MRSRLFSHLRGVLFVVSIVNTLLLHSVGSLATPIRFTFSGAVTDVPGQLSGGFQEGQKLNGVLTFERQPTNTRDIWGDGGALGTQGSYALTSVIGSIGRYNFASNSGWIEVQNNYVPAPVIFPDSRVDGYSIWTNSLTGGTVSGRAPEGFNINLYDDNAQLFGSTAVPLTPPSLSISETKTWSLQFDEFDIFGSSTVRGSLSALATVPTVIAPSSGHLIGDINPTKEHTVVITHGIQLDDYTGIPPTWVADMKKAILAKAPDANVVVWNWSEAYAGSDPPPEPVTLESLLAVYVGAKTALPYAQSSGQQLAKALEAAGAKGIQLIGHSAGNHVNAYAADALQRLGMAPEQVTILDRPFGKAAYSSKVDNLVETATLRNLLGKVESLDNYYGGLLSTGSSLPSIVGAQYNYNYSGANHNGVHDQYYASIQSGEHSGFYWSVANPNGQPIFDVAPVGEGATFINVPLADQLLESWNKVNASLDGSAVRMFEGSPAYFWGDLTIPENAAFLTFDMLWSDKGDGDFLSVFFNDVLLYSFLGIDFIGNDFLNVGLLPISDFAGQTGQLLFALNSVGDSNANFYIRNLTMGTVASSQVPIPGTVGLIGVGLAGLISFRRRAVKLACKAA